MQVVPWYDFGQGAAEACLHVFGRKRLSESAALNAMIVFLDKITRVYRYSDDNLGSAERWLALCWGHILRRHFQGLFHDILMDIRFYAGIDSHMSRPAENFPEGMDFLFRHGRAGFYALYFAKLEVCYKSLEKYIFNHFDLHGRRPPLPRRDEIKSLLARRENWFISPYLACLTHESNSGTQYSIIRGHALAAINLREESIRLAKGSEPRIVQECEEVVAVYALVFANSGEAVMNGEPVRWCKSLMRQSFM
jgi:hypothetical protein